MGFSKRRFKFINFGCNSDQPQPEASPDGKDFGVVPGFIPSGEPLCRFLVFNTTPSHSWGGSYIQDPGAPQTMDSADPSRRRNDSVVTPESTIIALGRMMNRKLANAKKKVSECRLDASSAEINEQISLIVIVKKLLDDADTVEEVYVEEFINVPSPFISE